MYVCIGMYMYIYVYVCISHLRSEDAANIYTQT